MGENQKPQVQERHLAQPQRQKAKRDSSLRRPIISQERDGKKKSACFARNDSFWGLRCYVGAKTPTPKGRLESCSTSVSFPFYCSAANHFLQVLRIASALHRDL